MIKNVFLDFNGTLIDDVDLCLKLLNDILRRQGNKEVSLEEYKNIFTFPIKKYYELAGVDFTKDSYEDLAIWFINAYQKTSLSCDLYDGVIDTIKFLRNKGINVYILSASEKNNLKEQCDHFGLTSVVCDVLGIDNIHAESKVSLAINYIKDNNINLKETIFVGDTLHDNEVARSLGVKSILIPNGHQSKERLEKSDAIIIDDFKDLMNKYDELLK